jgi:hypothetical protein
MLYGASIGSPLLFVRGDACAKNNRRREVHRSVAPYFLYVVTCVLKVIEAERYVSREPHAFADVLAHWSCVRSCVSPLCRSGQACDWVEHHRTSICVEMLIVLHSLKGRALRTNQALLKSIGILKAGSPKSRFVGARNLVQHFMSTLVRDDEDIL